MNSGTSRGGQIAGKIHVFAFNDGKVFVMYAEWRKRDT